MVAGVLGDRPLHGDRGTLGTVRFASRFGVLLAHTRHDGTITLDFPAAAPTQAAAPDGLAEAPGGIPEDPVTGSAHTALPLYWHPVPRGSRSTGCSTRFASIANSHDHDDASGGRRPARPRC